MKTELKPCPFCGKKPKIMDWTLVDEWQIACRYKHCPASPVTMFYADKDKAIAKWNKRKP